VGQRAGLYQSHPPRGSPSSAWADLVPLRRPQRILQPEGAVVRAMLLAIGQGYVTPLGGRVPQPEDGSP